MRVSSGAAHARRAAAGAGRALHADIHVQGGVNKNDADVDVVEVDVMKLS